MPSFMSIADNGVLTGGREKFENNPSPKIFKKN